MAERAAYLSVPVLTYRRLDVKKRARQMMDGIYKHHLSSSELIFFENDLRAIWETLSNLPGTYLGRLGGDLIHYIQQLLLIGDDHAEADSENITSTHLRKEFGAATDDAVLPTFRRMVRNESTAQRTLKSVAVEAQQFVPNFIGLLGQAISVLGEMLQEAEQEKTTWASIQQTSDQLDAEGHSHVEHGKSDDQRQINKHAVETRKKESRLRRTQNALSAHKERLSRYVTVFARNANLTVAPTQIAGSRA